jgi:hypothetical protein
MEEFRESQGFTQAWIWIIGLMPVLIIVSVFITELVGNKVINSEDIIAMASALVITLLTFLWIKLLRLETHIDSKGINVRFKGLVFAKRTIEWSEIEDAEITGYDPLWDYGGWGVRYRPKNGWCYNVAGNVGLKLKLKNGKSFLIGTQKPDEIKKLLDVISIK